MAQTAHKRATRKDTTIQIRASAETKALINRAASLRGQKLSEFALETIRARAEDTLLDQRLFILDPKAHEQFLKILDSPVRPSKKLRALLNRKPPWKAR
jgi:uncharacterized protein (DUF1778 family)